MLCSFASWLGKVTYNDWQWLGRLAVLPNIDFICDPIGRLDMYFAELALGGFRTRAKVGPRQWLLPHNFDCSALVEPIGRLQIEAA